MVGVENSENVERALRQTKEKYGLNPKLVTCDFAPSMTSAVKKVFGENVLQIDGFHVMQLLNNGIRKDLAVLANNLFKKEINELYQLRDWICDIQKSHHTSSFQLSRYINPFPTEKPIVNTVALDTCNRFLKLLSIRSLSQFSTQIFQILYTSISDDFPAVQHLYTALRNKYPKRGFTNKKRYHFERRILQKLKSFLLVFRKSLDVENTHFSHLKWLIFIQPSNLSDDQADKLADLLTKYPELVEYRDLTLRLGSIYSKDVCDIDGREIDDLVIQDHFTDKLQTAITTIKHHKLSILRFVDVFLADPSLTPANRSSMEYENRRFKAPFTHGLNCTGVDHLIGKLQLQLTPDVRWYLE